jgi:hypothetical protein
VQIHYDGKWEREGALEIETFWALKIEMATSKASAIWAVIFFTALNSSTQCRKLESQSKGNWNVHKGTLRYIKIQLFILSFKITNSDCLKASITCSQIGI